ncbi:MAG TPA: DNA polymerase III subunit gamma/tau [Thermoanaerobaculia bacterium]|jgi:DNA polymerase-3 subunit gamma/tau
MSYQALARKYRPQSFDDVVGQQTAVQTLQNAIESQRIHHAYLFSGVRGIGKTTLARILAKALNCEQGPTPNPDNACSICREITEGIDLDVREIDAATYTGVDNVRELRDVSQFQPARDHYRIFIIDEAHMLSTASWNALLKLIEEPPPHVIFMFATTEMNKVPTTILSRVQKILLRKITLDDLIARLSDICKVEEIAAERAALEIIARRGEGSVRDSLSLLDQVIAFSGRSVTVADVATILGLSDTTFFARVVAHIAAGEHGALLEALQEAADSGRDFKMLYRDLLNFVRNLLLLAGGANEAMLGCAPEDMPAIRSAAEQFSYSELLRIANLLLRDDETVNRAEHQRLAVEIALLKAATFPRLKSVEQVLAGDRSAAAPAPAPQRASATAAAAPQRATPAASAPSAPATPRGDGSVESFLERAKKARPMLGGYLSAATSARKDGTRVVLQFDDAAMGQIVADEKTSLEKIAAEVYGAPTQVIIESGSSEPGSGRRAEDRPSPMQDDPVLSAFRKHLGGELVKEMKR